MIIDLESYADVAAAVTRIVRGFLTALGACAAVLIAMWLRQTYRAYRRATDYGTRLDAEANLRLALAARRQRELAADTGVLEADIGGRLLDPSQIGRTAVWRRERRGFSRLLPWLRRGADSTDD